MRIVLRQHISRRGIVLLTGNTKVILLAEASCTNRALIFTAGKLPVSVSAPTKLGTVLAKRVVDCNMGSG